MRAKPGQIKVGYSKREQDTKFAWGGGGATKSDAALLMFMLSLKYGDQRDSPTFLEELELRGYDLSTLRISIEKKAQQP